MAIVVFLVTGLSIASFTPFYSSYTQHTAASPREERIQNIVLDQVMSFQNYIKDTFLVEVGKDHPDSQKIRQVFLKSRLLYKKFEWAAEYFAADLAERLNGPPVQEIENADLLDPSLARAIDPMGLQVIEESVYPQFDTSGKNKLVVGVTNLVTNTGYLVSYFTDHPLADWRILDAAKLEVFRIIALGISGFDAQHSGNSINECAESLNSLQDVLRFYLNKNSTPLLQDLSAAISYLHDNADFDSFDRAVFITRFANKISAKIARLERDLHGPGIKYNRMLRQEARTLFDSGAFNVNAFTPGPEYHVTDAKVVLGEKLFYDASLSGTGTRSCASCHNPRLAFTDGLAKERDLHDTSRLILRNVPTLLDAALQSNYFYDMRALTLEDQVKDVIANQHEMDGSMEAIIKYVSADTSYHTLFVNAFPRKNKEITANEVANALASYVRSLVKLNSRFDEYMRGKENALSVQELKGFNLFMGKAKCATCHFAPLFNGITPPKYVMSETEVLGVPVSQKDSTIDPDMGYYGVIEIDSYKYAFKVPTIRNVDKTAPYMHNGVYRTLEQVMDFYNNGGGAGLGINLPNQTLSKENLHLTEKEKEDIIAFMRSLDSK
ncbi:cytochrome c peroxidase [Hanamia caeni]|nr:cytochrome c peroxidase [Hanamia caeni]